jgi:AcrR family transcriptional regulator
MATRAPALPAEERRAAIVSATLPLLLERGTNVSTRQIAEAAGIAEGTIFSVFPDKDAVVQAVLQAALDPEPTERDLAAIDRSLPFVEQLIAAVHVMQRRSHRIWRLVSSLGDATAPLVPPADFVELRDIFARQPEHVRVDAANAGRMLRALTLAVSNPMYFAGDPMDAREVVALFLDGVRLRDACAHEGSCA